MRLLALLTLLISASAAAIDAGVAFEDPEMQARYERLIEEVRCLKCQNQSIRDSNAFLAADLRREIRRMMAEGKTDEEIYSFLVARYGEFALYRPRSNVFWLAPFALILIGGIVAIRVVRGRMALPVDDADGSDETDDRQSA